MDSVRGMFKRRLSIAAVGCLAVCLWPANAASPADYENVIREISSAAGSEVREGHLTGVTIALVDDQQIVFAGGFGFADKNRRRLARSDTVYRAGSISKLFTAVAT